MDKGFLFLAGIEFSSVEFLKEITVGKIARFKGQLPVVGKELTMLERESPSQITFGRYIFSAAYSSEPVLTMVIYDIAADIAEIILAFVSDFSSGTDAPVAKVINRKGRIRTLRLAQTQQTGHIPPGLNAHAEGVVVSHVDRFYRHVRASGGGSHPGQTKNRYATHPEPHIPQIGNIIGFSFGRLLLNRLLIGNDYARCGNA